MLEALRAAFPVLQGQHGTRRNAAYVRGVKAGRYHSEAIEESHAELVTACMAYRHSAIEDDWTYAEQETGRYARISEALARSPGLK